jgi:hypothetical protein
MHHALRDFDLLPFPSPASSTKGCLFRLLCEVLGAEVGVALLCLLLLRARTNRFVLSQCTTAKGLVDCGVWIAECLPVDVCTGIHIFK